MDHSIAIAFGTPQHGWLPVDFHYQDFHLDFSASVVLNDSIDELYDAIFKLEDSEARQVIWWLEPAAYFFDFVRKGQNITLTISETQDLHSESDDKIQLIIITADYKKIIEPFRIALRKFCSQIYEENHWPYKLHKDKIERL